MNAARQRGRQSPLFYVGEHASFIFGTAEMIRFSVFPIKFFFTGAGRIFHLIFLPGFLTDVGRSE
ncbi:hypothetical protein XI05_07415 [Bradyrhizobium sp. CCBAU 11357]|nr:hypothetical protein [Bradyrhizobium sp. CCBAU 11357]